jgi:hypothetical protein
MKFCDGGFKLQIPCAISLFSVLFVNLVRLYNYLTFDSGRSNNYKKKRPEMGIRLKLFIYLVNLLKWAPHAYQCTLWLPTENTLQNYI